MSKKKATKKTKPASAARKRAKSRSSRSPRSAAVRPEPGKVQLKPIIVLIDRALVDLKRLPPTASTNLAIKQLEIALMAITDVCNVAPPDGCGPSMEFPPPGL